MPWPALNAGKVIEATECQCPLALSAIHIEHTPRRVAIGQEIGNRLGNILWSAGASYRQAPERVRANASMAASIAARAEIPAAGLRLIQPESRAIEPPG